MKIKLLSLELKNFKGEKDRLINFGDFTEIEGKNGTGKSTIFDAFCWVLFGKDSTDRKVFSVQPYDESNNIIHHLDTVVTASLNVDGVTKIFKRTLKEKWQKQRGAAEQELKGTETLYEIDDIPVKQKDYLEKISEILIEDNFKLLSNPLYFPNMEWKKQREILFQIIGDISEESVINYNSNLKGLTELLQGKTIDEFNEKVKFNIKKLKDKVKDIPARIDENNSMICNEDFSELEKEKIEIQKKIDTLDSQLTDLSKANEGKLKLQEQLFELKGKLGTLRNEASKNANKPLEEIQAKINNVKSEIQELNFKIRTAKNKRDRFSDTNLETEKEIQKLSAKREEMLEEYHKVEDEQFAFDEKETVCKCCGRPFDMDKIQEIKEEAKIKFEENKKHNLEAIKQGGAHFKPSIAKAELLLAKDKEEVNKLTNEVIELEKQNSELEKSLESLEKQKSELNVENPVIEGEAELLDKIQSTEAEINNFKSNDNSALLSQKKELQDQLSIIDKTLGKKDTNEELKKRIQELMQEEKYLNIQIAELEKQQFLGEEFIRTKVELLEDTINKKFGNGVSFRLFKEQVNGGICECCELTYKGINYSDVNSAAKINVGLMVIDVLSKHYNIFVPVWTDNAESVNEIYRIDSQMIDLKVSESNELKVEVK